MMRRVWAVAAALILLIPGSSFGQAGGPKEWMAHPPIHPRGPARATLPAGGYQPAQILSIYGFTKLVGPTGSVQTIAIVDAFDDPSIVNDLETFIGKFGLAGMNYYTNGCTVTAGPYPCFQKVTPGARTPKTNGGWALEISLDVEWAHAIAPRANILLVEATTNSFSNLMAAVKLATGTQGVRVVSMSWGGGEFSSETSYDGYFNPKGANIMFTASSGDSGSGTEWPAASPYVLSVGGTTLAAGTNSTYEGETAWSGSGGGISTYEGEPAYQSGFSSGDLSQASGHRGIPDVAFDADPNTGVYVYDTTSYYGQTGWFVIGGTSVGAPSWAAVIALADESRTSGLSTSLLASPLYSAAASSYNGYFHDITTGSNGTCNICYAGAGYDFVTGLGSPIANNLIPYLDSH